MSALSFRGVSLRALLVLVMIAGIAGTVQAQSEVMARTVNIDIDAQPLAAALIEFSEQAGVQIIAPAATVQDVATKGVHGQMPLSKALDKLLQGTRLGYHQTGANTIGIDAPQSPGSALSDTNSTSQPEPSTTAKPGNGPAEAITSKGGDEQRAEGSSQELQQVVVVGSRIPQSAKDSAVPIDVYTREDIDRSGASSVAQFLNTISQVSAQDTTTGNLQNYGGATTVQLHGLPEGTTLVLINGRRLESTSGAVAATSFFDLNQIPMAAVDRIEVLPSGSSAVYGGDALGGIINIVLKQGYQGAEADVRYGRTSDGAYNEAQYSLSAGWKSDRWSLSLVGMYADNSELSGTERYATTHVNPAGAGLSRYSDPGNVCSANGKNLNGLNAACAGVPKGSTGENLIPADFTATAGILNKSVLISGYSYLAPSSRYGFYAYGTYDLVPSVQLFTELLYSKLKQQSYTYQPVTALSVPASNVYNPFGENVIVSYQFAGIGRGCECKSVDYARPLVGLRGTLASRWDWEIAAWTSRDWDHMPDFNGIRNAANITSALANGTFNPFQDGPGASLQVLSTFYSVLQQDYRGSTDAANAFIRGRLLSLPSGDVQAVVGGEYQRDGLDWEVPATASNNFALRRESEAGFAELKVPIIGNHAHPGLGDTLSTQLAIRYDRYSDFGSHASAQAGLEFRPVASLLLRASYSSAFKPPSIYQLDRPALHYPDTVNDPQRGGQSENVDYIIGGTPSLKPETGWSRNIGLVFSPDDVKGLDVSLTNWMIRLRNGFAGVSDTQIVNDPDAFPRCLTRAAPGPGDPYPVGPIISINCSFANFGFIDEAGLDLGVKWHKRTAFGEFLPSLSVTNTYRYIYERNPALGPQGALSQAIDGGNFAPRWKGTLALSWTKGLFQAGADGRYVGSYKDVTDLTPEPRSLGNFSYIDANFRYDFGKEIAPASRYLSGAFVSGGVRNLFNRQPQYSDYLYGETGYDPTESDLVGRLLWVQAGLRFD